MRVLNNIQLLQEIEDLGDEGRIKLLAKLRLPDEEKSKITDHERQQIWFLLRLLVIRSVVKRWKVKYHFKTEWWKEINPNDNQISYRYYPMTDRIVDLALSIKNYKKPHRYTPPEWNDVIATKKALRGYHMAYCSWETEGKLRHKGISFSMYVHYKNGGKEPRYSDYAPRWSYGGDKDTKVSVSYNDISRLEGLLRVGEWNPAVAVKTWADNHRKKYEKFFLGETEFKARPVTHSRVLNMYINLLRHSFVHEMASNMPNISELGDDDFSEDGKTVDNVPAENLFVGAYSLSDLLAMMRKEIRNGEFLKDKFS
jgi:hypothetical protein